MILVNLLPQGLRRARRWSFAAVTVRQGAVGVVAALGVVTIGLGFWRVGLASAHRRLDAEWKGLQATRSQVAEARDRLQTLERQAGQLTRVRATSPQWAPRLNLLSDALAPGVWFTRLTVEPVEAKRPAKASSKGKKGRTPPAVAADRRIQLLVAGTALIPDGGAPSPLAALLRSLKQQPEFTRSFEAVELKDVERRKLGPLDVSDFVLRFDVREPSVSSTR